MRPIGLDVLEPSFELTLLSGICGLVFVDVNIDINDGAYFVKFYAH